MSKQQGLLIVLEGVDRCGKTTQCARLVERLQRDLGQPCESLRFPCRETEIGKIIDSYLKSTSELSDQAIHLLFSANRWEMNNEMRRKLDAGIHLVVDRYKYSGQVFTLVKNTPGIDMAWCKAPDVGLPEPDLVFFLDLPVEKSAKRGKFGEERYEREEMQRKVREAFLDLARENEGNMWQVVNADDTMEAVEEVIWERVQSKLSKKSKDAHAQ